MTLSKSNVYIKRDCGSSIYDAHTLTDFQDKSVFDISKVTIPVFDM